MNNKIFISGRITGDPNYVEKFYQAEKRLKTTYDVVNPCYLQFLGFATGLLFVAHLYDGVSMEPCQVLHGVYVGRLEGEPWCKD